MKYVVTRSIQHWHISQHDRAQFISASVSPVAQHDISTFKFSGSNESHREAESKSSQQAKRRKERQQQYEQKRKRSFQKKWIEEFDRMDINKYRPGQNKQNPVNVTN